MLTLLELLAPRQVTADRFVAEAGHGGWARLFGGQVVAQALAAATATVEDQRPAHSLHALFIRPGRFDVPITLDVARDRDGRSISARRVVAAQDGEPILTMLASFHRLEEGVAHGALDPEEMAALPPPEDLPTFLDLVPPGVSSSLLRGPMVEMDIRPVDGCRPTVGRPGPPRGTMWFRLPGGAGADAAVQRVLLAYASDMCLIGAATRPYSQFAGGRGSIASIDHAIWFHAEARTDEWLLYVQESPWAGRARGLARGLIVDRTGRFVASVSQEGLMRLP